jgi:hypothetical protein
MDLSRPSGLANVICAANVINLSMYPRFNRRGEPTLASIQNPKSKIQNPKSKIQNPKSILLPDQLTLRIDQHILICALGFAIPPEAKRAVPFCFVSVERRK